MLLGLVAVLIIIFMVMISTRGGDTVSSPEFGMFVTWTEGEVLFSGNGEISEIWS